MSTIKVNGEMTQRTRPFRADDPPKPTDVYSRSKASAEAELLCIAQSTELGITVIRSPLVYGPGARANFGRLSDLAGTRLPVPSGLLKNSRSLISVENLAAAVADVVGDGRAHGRTYLVRDGVDVSTGELIIRMRRAQGSPIRKIPVPAATIRWALRRAGKEDIENRILGSLTIDDTPIRDELGWTPSQTLQQGIEAVIGELPRRRRLLYFITEDWYFASHRLALAKAACEADWDVHVACHVNDHREVIEQSGIEVHPLSLDRGGRHPGRELLLLKQLQGVIQKVRPDVMHNVALKPVLYGSWLARSEGVPVTVNALAGLGSVLSSQQGIGLSRGAVMSMMRRTLGTNDQWMIVQNRDDAQFVLHHHLAQARRLRLIPGSGVDTEQFGFSPPVVGNDHLVATVVARMLWDKGVGETVEAARLLKQWGIPVTVQLVGDPDPHNPRSILESQLKQWNDEGVVRWLGRRDDIAQIWRDSDIAVLASYGEGMPKSLLEAAAVGRPLIACDVPGCRDLVTDGVTGRLVAPRNARALANAITELASDPEGRVRMGEQARRVVAARYSQADVSRAQLDLYAVACGLSTGGLTRDMRA